MHWSWSLLACDQHIFAFGGVEAEMVLVHPVVDCINVILEDIKILRAANSSV